MFTWNQVHKTQRVNAGDVRRLFNFLEAKSNCQPIFLVSLKITFLIKFCFNIQTMQCTARWGHVIHSQN